MSKKVMAAASFEKQKYFLDPDFSSLPDSIKNEIKSMCVNLAQSLKITFIIGFSDDCDIYFECIKPENLVDFDDIGFELEISRIRKEKKELFTSLAIWYAMKNEGK